MRLLVQTGWMQRNRCLWCWWHDKSSIVYLRGIEAGQRRAQDFEEVASISQRVVGVMIVGVRVVSMPIQNVIPHIQAIPGDVCWRIPQAVKLIPQQPPFPARGNERCRQTLHVYMSVQEVMPENALYAARDIVFEKRGGMRTGLRRLWEMACSCQTCDNQHDCMHGPY